MNLHPTLGGEITKEKQNLKKISLNKKKGTFILKDLNLMELNSLNVYFQIEVSSEWGF